jgi:hypothetical protein
VWAKSSGTSLQGKQDEDEEDTGMKADVQRRDERGVKRLLVNKKKYHAQRLAVALC